MAQSHQFQGERWLADTKLPPPFAAPNSAGAWEVQRGKIRSALWPLLGELPPRPKLPQGTTISREDRGEVIVEKVSFENGAGAVVPGYLLLPKGTIGRAPGILFCHWHGGEYEIGKEELFKS